MKKVDITEQCTVGLEPSYDGGSLVYLYAPAKTKKENLDDRKIGLFDRHGFYYMTGHEVEEKYSVEEGFKTAMGIAWFKVYARRGNK